MERKERLKEAFEYLRGKGEVHTQADIADKMKASRPNVSSAFSGDAKCLTDKFLIRFNKAFGRIFSDDWLLHGEGEMLHPLQKVGDISNSNVSGVNVSGTDIHINPDAYSTLLEIVKANQKTTEKFQEQIDRMLSIIEMKYGAEDRGYNK